MLPPLAYFVVVALLRQANDGSVSGYAPLALLPVVWIALNLGRQEVAVGIAVGASVFVLPLLVGDPASYPSGEWRRAVLWTGVALIVGYSVESLTRYQARADACGARPRANHRRNRRRDARIDRGDGRAFAHLPRDSRDRRGNRRCDLRAGRDGRPRHDGSSRPGHGPATTSPARRAVRIGTSILERFALLRRRRGPRAPRCLKTPSSAPGPSRCSSSRSCAGT